MTPDELEAARDIRSTDELMAGMIHLIDGDTTTDWWRSDRCYQFYAAIAKLIKPTSVLEVGVRLGNSLIAMYQGHQAIERIVGIDGQFYVGNSQKLAFDNIRAVGFIGQLDLPVVNSMNYSLLPHGVFDIAHVDGDHTYSGALIDIAHVWEHIRPGGILIVDDTDFVEDVRRAVESAKQKIDMQDGFYFNTLRGCWVATKPWTQSQ